MAVENLLQPNLNRRWLVTFVFGLVHGFGFSFLLQSKLQFAGTHLLTSLLAFNVGIELGQLLLIALVIPLLTWIVRAGRISERALALFIALVVGHTAWHWMLERVEALGTVQWPEDEQLLKGAPYAVAVVVALGVLYGFVRQRNRLANGAHTNISANAAE